MSTTAIAKNARGSESGPHGEETKQPMTLPSLKVILGCLALVALVLALGMTGGQVRELAGRVTVMEDEREGFERRVDKLRADNKQLIVQLRDYQVQIEAVQGSNIALAKRLVNRDMAVEDLQDSLDSILKEKYTTENELRGEIAKLEDLKRDLSAQVSALGEAVSAQSQEIAQLDEAYREAQGKMASAGERNTVLVAENNRYLTLLNQMQDDLDAVQEEGEVMAERFAALQSESAAVEAERVAIERELQAMKSEPVGPFGVDGASDDPFEGSDPFGLEAESTESSASDALFGGDKGGDDVASADGQRSA